MGSCIPTKPNCATYVSNRHIDGPQSVCNEFVRVVLCDTMVRINNRSYVVKKARKNPRYSHFYTDDLWMRFHHSTTRDLDVIAIHDLKTVCIIQNLREEVSQ